MFVSIGIGAIFDRGRGRKYALIKPPKMGSLITILWPVDSTETFGPQKDHFCSSCFPFLLSSIFFSSFVAIKEGPLFQSDRGISVRKHRIIEVSICPI